jgi:cell division protein FtsQ
MIDAGRSLPRLLGGRRRPGKQGGGNRRIPLRAPRVRPGLLLALIAVALLLGGAWLWFRDSSFVSVKRVSVTGLNGPDAGRIRRALRTAALNMTTLDISMSQLRTAVAPYPVVKDLRVSTQFPHGISIRVIEQIPVAEITVGGRTIEVAGDGTLVHDGGPSSLPQIPLRVPPGGTRLTGSAMGAVAVLAAAPYEMLARVSQVTTNNRHGIEAQLRNGPAIYFGDADRLDAKWTAAIAVIGDPSSAGAAYVDVSDPERPAAGGGSPSQSTTGGSSSSSSQSATAGSSSTPSQSAPVGSSTPPSQSGTVGSSSTSGATTAPAGTTSGG